MVASLDFQLRTAPAELFEGARWTVLTMFILHANIRNRAWPSMRGLADRLGKSLPHITEAKQWLVDHGAVTLVPNQQRVGKEKELPNHHHVYQLTGEIKLGDRIIKYLHISDDNGQVNDKPDESLNPSPMINTANSKPRLPESIPSKDSKSPIELNTLANPPSGVSQPPPEPLSGSKNLPDGTEVTGDPNFNLLTNLLTETQKQQDALPPSKQNGSQPIGPAEKPPPVPPGSPLPVKPADWFVVAGDIAHGPYPSYEAAKRGSDEHQGMVTQGQVIGSKTVRTVPKAPKVKPERKPDPVFDAIALGSFGLAKVVGKVGGRIGGIVKEVKECTAPEHLPALAADLVVMYEWRKRTYPQLSAPTQGLTICKYLAEWRATVTTADVVPRWVADPDRPGAFITPVQLRARLAEKEMLNHV